MNSILFSQFFVFVLSKWHQMKYTFKYIFKMFMDIGCVTTFSFTEQHDAFVILSVS